ncbi:hypothetical protein [Campylobacter lari]|uniref:hypothetical protein n=1 Tax=Campylobacter lari TaxID=201 RepID=UPI0021534A37|nr:hypothetical protein [Campylobacter lari]MCR6543385.1 hypothetical protein [Campylobacter lari]
MAYYNPQQVVFNPSLGVIQNAGKVGGVLYNSMKQYREEENKRRLLAQRDEELKARQEQNEINNAFLNNNLLQKERAFEYAMEQDRIKNNLELQKLNQLKLSNELNFKSKYGFLEPSEDVIEGMLKDNTGIEKPYLLSSNEKNLMQKMKNPKKEIGFLDTFADGFYAGKENRDTYSKMFYNAHNEAMLDFARAKYGSQVTNKQQEDIERIHGLPSFSFIRDQIPLDRFYKLKSAQADTLKKAAYDKTREKLLKPSIYNHPVLRREAIAEYKNYVKKIDEELLETKKWLGITPNNPGKIVDISQEPSNQPIITPLVDGTYLVEKDGKFYEASYAELKQMGVFE